MFGVWLVFTFVILYSKWENYVIKYRVNCVYFREDKMIKRFKRTGLFLLGILLVIVVIVIALFWNELRSLRSLKKVDDYGMF